MRVLFGFIGLVVGYPISYFFQSELVRTKMSLGDYVQHMSDVFETIKHSQSSGIAWTAIITMIVCMVIGSIIGGLLTCRRPTRND